MAEGKRDCTYMKGYEFCGTLDEVVKKLTDFWNSVPEENGIKHKCLSLETENDGYGGSDCPVISLDFSRPLTKKETNERKAMEDRQKMYRHQQYEQLKKEFKDA